MKENNSKKGTLINTIRIVSFAFLAFLFVMFIMGVTVMPNYEESSKESLDRKSSCRERV